MNNKMSCVFTAHMHERINNGIGIDVHCSGVPIGC